MSDKWIDLSIGKGSRVLSNRYEVVVTPDQLAIIEAVLAGSKPKQLQKGFFDDENPNSDYYLVEVPHTPCPTRHGKGRV